MALVLAAATAAAARANHGYVMPWDTFQPRGWDKYHDTNRILRSKCRDPFTRMEDFAGKALKDVLPTWRHVKLDRLKAKRERIRDRASLCTPVALGRQIALEYGWGADQFWHLHHDYGDGGLFDRESGWNPCRHYPSTTNCAYTGPSACGIPQFVPCSKLLDGCGTSLGSCSVATQIRKGYDYIRARYGTPAAANAYQLAHGYY